MRILKKTEERVNASVAGRSTAYSVAGGLRYAVTTEESSDLSAAWPDTDPTLRKGSARGRVIGGMDTEVVQLRTGTVLSLISLK